PRDAAYVAGLPPPAPVLMRQRTQSGTPCMIVCVPVRVTPALTTAKDARRASAATRVERAALARFATFMSGRSRTPQPELRVTPPPAGPLDENVPRSSRTASG